MRFSAPISGRTYGLGKVDVGRKFVMRKLVAAAVLVLGLMGGVGASGAVTTSAAPPPAPGPWEHSRAAGCWQSLLERHVEHRTGSYTSSSGQVIRYTEFRSAATSLHWCPGTKYKVIAWHGVWHPGRR